jgi:hypothetical protein
MADISKHRRRSWRRTRQPIGFVIDKPKPVKAKAKATLSALFDWHGLEPKALAERVDQLRKQAFTRVFTTAEWAEFELMVRAAHQANAEIKKMPGHAVRPGKCR